MKSDDVRAALDALRPEIPWTHYFNLAGVETISRDRDQKFFNKSVAANKIAKIALRCSEVFGGGIKGKRVLDIASAEGAMSIACSQAGAGEVIGIEGRQIYVDRSTFVAKALGTSNAHFVLGDVRKIPESLGSFDMTICSGILHHLGEVDFFPFLQSISKLTNGFLFLYTHVSTAAAIREFRLQGPREPHPGLVGYAYQEHADGASEKERHDQVRASLDNTFSFWATEETLVKALKLSGFSFVTKLFEPHPFGGYENKNLRVVFVAMK